MSARLEFVRRSPDQFAERATDYRRSFPDWIRCVVVGIPARDEEHRVEACVRSVLAAGDALGDGVTVFVVLAADSCADSTVAAAGLASDGDRRMTVLSGEWRSAGAARAAAIDDGSATARAAGFSAAATWIATTDADTTVGVDWLRRQLQYADIGVHAVAGTVDLRDDVDRTDLVARAFARNYPVGTDSHPHVHGANLGVRADAYEAAGGFPRIELAEDHALWAELKRLGYRCLSALDIPVATSARLTGRAIGGFADTIAALVG